MLNGEQSSLCPISVSFFFVIIVEWASILCEKNGRVWNASDRVMDKVGDGKKKRDIADMLVFGGTRSC